MRKTASKLIILTYLVSTILFCNQMAVNGPDDIEKEEFKVTATDFGVMCISTAYPEVGMQIADSRDNELATVIDKIDTVPKIEEATSDKDKVKDKSKDKSKENLEPRVLIVHTHATESYLPSSEGNFHTRNEENTVRDVGNSLTETLESRGIGVVHDKTLHDYPSYNDSYYKSYDTTEALLKEYPTIECVIDLHRDAVASQDHSPTVAIGGKTCAKYSFVVGTLADTYDANMAFVSKLNSTALKKYNGFTGAVLERGYRYNQDLSSKYLLLEIGFNRNQIEDCRNTAVVFGNILAETLNED